MFYIGQKVVCVKSAKGIKKGVTYTVTEICNCSNCGLEAVCVGEKEDEQGKIGECASCHNTYWLRGIEREEISYKPSRFAPLETYRESYSIAIELVQQMEQVDKQKIFNPKKVEI